MMLALALLLAQAIDPCTQVKRIVRTSVEGFTDVRGVRHEDSGTTVSWTDPEKLPGALRCKVVEYKDGSPPFYGCEMTAGSCKNGEQSFLGLVKDVSTCLNAPPQVNDDGKKKTARMHKGGVPVRVQYKAGKDCQLRFFVEPLPPVKK